MTPLARAFAVLGALCLHAPTSFAFSLEAPIAKADVFYNTVIARGHSAKPNVLRKALHAHSAGVKACVLKTLGANATMGDASGMTGRVLEGEFWGPLLAFKLHQLPGGGVTAEVLSEQSPRIRPCLIEALKAAKLPATTTEAVVIGEFQLIHKAIEPQPSGFSSGPNVPSTTTVADLKAVRAPWMLGVGKPSKLAGKLTANALEADVDGSNGRTRRCFYKTPEAIAKVTFAVTTNSDGHVNAAKAVGKHGLKPKILKCVVDGLTHEARFAGRGRGGGGFSRGAKPKNFAGSGQVELTFSPPPKPMKVR